MRAPSGASRAKTDWSQLLVDAVSKPGVISQAYSLFHEFSVGNQILALLQCHLRQIPPGPIKTFRGWLKLNRHVKRGEKALVLVMPVTVKRKAHEPAPDGAVETSPTSPAEYSTAVQTYTMFVERPLWFVLGQTEGDPYQAPSAPEWDQSLALHALLVDQVPFTHTNGNVQGYAQDRSVAVSPIAFLPHRTLFHELAHVVLGHTAEVTGLSDGSDATPRDLREVEAESVALLCSESLGLTGADFSRGYIQHWWKHSTIPEKSVHRIFKAADTILRAGRAEEKPDTDVADVPAA